MENIIYGFIGIYIGLLICKKLAILFKLKK